MSTPPENTPGSQAPGNTSGNSQPQGQPPAHGTLPHARAAVAPESGPRDLVLVKDGQRLIFRCDPGHEAELIQRLAEMAEDPGHHLTWFDAAVLSHQMGQHLSRTLQTMNKAS